MAYIWRGDLTEGFLRYEFGGLIYREAYFQNFTELNVPWFQFQMSKNEFEMDFKKSFLLLF